MVKKEDVMFLTSKKFTKRDLTGLAVLRQGEDNSVVKKKDAWARKQINSRPAVCYFLFNITRLPGIEVRLFELFWQSIAKLEFTLKNREASGSDFSE